MRRIVVLSLIGVFTLTIVGCCSITRDLVKSHHENNSTIAVLNTNLEKVNAAIPKATLNAGYSVNQTKSTPGEFEHKGDGIKITCKKLDEKKSKIFIRTGFSGDPDKEGLILKEIKKELRLK